MGLSHSPVQPAVATVLLSGEIATPYSAPSRSAPIGTRRVRITVSGREFTKAYEAEIPSVVVMDVIMPGMDGVELAGWLAETKFDGHVVVVTSFAPLYADLVASLGNAGGIKSVTKLFKPVRIKALREALTFDEVPV